MPPDAPAAERPADTGADFGLTAEELTAYNEMRSAPPQSGEPGNPTPEEPSETPAPAPDAPAAPAAAAGEKTVTAPAADEDDDEPDPAAVAGPDGVKLPKRVSYNKFRRLEDEAKAAKAELETERSKAQKAAETQARLDERLRLINEALTPAPAAAQDDDPEPDPEKDIFGHNAWLKRQLVKTRETYDERFRAMDAERETATAERQIAEVYVTDAQQFAAREPTFLPAYSYLMQVRMAQLANYHFGKDLTDPTCPPLTAAEVARIKQDVAAEERQLVSQAIKAGKSPAAAVFAMAKMTGFRPQAPAATAEAAGAPAAANGVKPPPGAAAPAVAAAVAAAAPANGNGAAPAAGSVRTEIEKLKAGQDAALSLSGGGGAPAPVLNAEKLANMPEEEFGAMLDNISRGELRRIMGG